MPEGLHTWPSPIDFYTSCCEQQINACKLGKEWITMTTLQKIRQKIIEREYYLSSHAEEEMLDDGLERRDIENAILKGQIEKKMTKDDRGIRYRIEGPALDERPIHVLCRFKENSNPIIITVYAL